ncbi:hypothetical protein DFH06DRAFT_1291040 [Mycena polygramma]|nr:hypothetical protein DFH06DRAFT_1291040 [Mycena polygramma]
MHPCLSVHEILVHIFQFVTSVDPPLPGSDEYFDRSSRIGLPSNPLSLALTCRTFLEPGLDLVWDQIQSVDVFKNCMPSHTASSPSLKRDRFKYYAKRVRRFGFARSSPLPSDSMKFINDVEILDDLVAAHPGSKILPNLVDLSVRGRDILEFLDFFVGDRLETLQIGILPLAPPRPMSPSFCQLQGPCRSLQLFSLSGCMLSPNEAAALSQTVSQFPSLQRFYWNHSSRECSEAAITHLSSLPNLNVMFAICSPGPERLNITAGFPQLQYLDIVVQDLDELMQRLDVISSTQLLRVGAQVHVEPTSAVQVQHTLAAIRDKLAEALDASVLLGNADVSPEDHMPDDSALLPAEIIHPLFALRNLTSLMLTLRRSLDVDDALLKTMADSWPRLQNFHLVHHDGVQTSAPIRLTLTGLIPLAANCTKLERCSLLVDATTLPADCFRHPAGRYTCPLHYFYVAHSSIAHAYRYQVAAFLSDLFPKLRRIAYSGSDEWIDVEDTLAIFSDFRKQEILTG